MSVNNPPLKPLISAKGIEKVIEAPDSSLTILHQLDLEIYPGEAVAIRGASGSGKSTLLALLAGLDLPSRGEITLFNQNITQLNEDERALLRAGRVGFIFQSFQLLPGMTALENVMLPLELAGDPQAANSARAILEQLGLVDRLRHTPNRLSGGEQQRVAIARAFAVKPRLLFADEPTGSLDQQTGEGIAELIFKQRLQSHSALLLVTHDPKLAARCDRILTLDQGALQPQAPT